MPSIEKVGLARCKYCPFVEHLVPHSNHKFYTFLLLLSSQHHHFASRVSNAPFLHLYFLEAGPISIFWVDPICI
ncbi:hypothetical protein NMG60_11015801 [Bertholletia excelsa]